MYRFIFIFTILFFLNFLYPQTIQKKDTNKNSIDITGFYKKIYENPYLSIDFDKEAHKLLERNLYSFKIMKVSLVNHQMKSSLEELPKSYIFSKELFAEEKYIEAISVLDKSEEALNNVAKEIGIKYKKVMDLHYKEIVAQMIDFQLDNETSPDKDLLDTIKKHESFYIKLKKQGKELEKQNSFIESLQRYKKSIYSIYRIKVLIREFQSLQNPEKKGKNPLNERDLLFWNDAQNHFYKTTNVEIQNKKTETTTKEVTVIDHNNREQKKESSENVETDNPHSN